MKEQLLEALAPIVTLLDTLDPASAEAEATLNERYPIDSDEMQGLAAMFAEGVKEGVLCDRDGGPGVTYSRVTKKLGAADFSIDAVRMDRPALGHTHPAGEFDLCFATDGEPEFDSKKPGWVVYPPGSWHVPSVRGGTMNILYFLPAGAIKFGPKEA
tara:strand:+ start:8706 stop:9176 length:471 start_codon:yes stop_codon:yes gene_type:complete